MQLFLVEKCLKCRSERFQTQVATGSGIRVKTGTVAVQYLNLNDASQQWTGSGRQPKWVKEWIESGKSLDLVRV